MNSENELTLRGACNPSSFLINRDASSLQAKLKKGNYVRIHASNELILPSNERTPPKQYNKVQVPKQCFISVNGIQCVFLIYLMPFAMRFLIGLVGILPGRHFSPRDSSRNLTKSIDN